MFWQRKELLAARVGKWKWVHMGDAAQGLFDLSNDPAERHNLAEEFPDVVRAVQARLHAWQTEMEQAEPRGPFRDY